MSKYIVDIHGDIEGDYELICKVESVIPIPKGATNGDMMQLVFPDRSTFNSGEGAYFKRNWWDAPYKRNGGQNETKK